MHCTTVTQQRPVHDQHQGHHSQKLQKALPDKDRSVVRHQDIRSLKTIKNFTPSILYEMTNHLLQ